MLTEEKKNELRAVVHAQQRAVVAKRPIDDAAKVIKQEREVFNARASQMADKILNAQAIAAVGTHTMVELRVDEEGKLHRNIVRDVTRQEQLLDHGIYGKEYLIVEGTPADWRAGDAILNRVWGKPKETVEMNVEHVFSLRSLNEQALEAPVVAYVAPPVEEETKTT